MDPFFRATTPDGRTSVEVLVPEGAEEAEAVLFKCSVKVNGRDTIEELETVDQNKMMNWVRRQMVEAMRRSTPVVGGEAHGLDSNRLGFLEVVILVDAPMPSLFETA